MYYLINGQNMDDSKLIETEKIRGIENTKLMEVDLGKYKIKVAAVSKMAEVKTFLKKLKMVLLRLTLLK